MEKTLSFLLLLSVLLIADGIRCYRCKNCSKFESSHSVACGSDSNACVKMDLKSGEVERSCGTLATCEEKTKGITESDYYTAVYCCQHDHCNGSLSIQYSGHNYILLILAAIVVRCGFNIGLY